jgi:prolyl oligopeptidase
MAVTSAMATLAKIKTKNNIPSKGATVDAYFDTKLPDPYRWLEDDKSAETGAWVKAKTSNLRISIKFRFIDVKSREWKNCGITKNRAPFKKNFVLLQNNGLQNQSVLYRDAKGRNVFLDPNTFSKDGTTSLGGLDFLKTVQVAYAISEERLEKKSSSWMPLLIK